MEGATTAQSTAIQAQNRPNSSQSLPPPSSRKRPLDDNNNDIFSHNSKHLKLRLLLKDLRPHFLEVLRTRDFRNCKAANEIQGQMKPLVKLYNQMITETISVGEKIVSESQPSLPSGNKDGQNPPEKASTETSEITGTYVVGGSAFGWNFIMYTGKDAVYYGVSKQSFRATRASHPSFH